MGVQVPHTAPRRGNMKVTVESNKGLSSELKVIVDKKEIEQKIESRLHELKDTINLKGFRPGKAPLELLKKHFGSAVYGEVLEKTLQQSAFDALKEKKITPANQPKIDVKKSGEDQDLEFIISVEQVPEIEKIDFNKIELNKFEVKSDKKEIDERLKNIAEGNKKYVEKKDKAEKDDLVVFDFVATVEGKDFEGNKGEKLQIVLGKDLFVPGFDKQLIGTKAGDEKIAKVNLPDNYPKEELAGKEEEIKCKIKEVKKGEDEKMDELRAKGEKFNHEHDHDRIKLEEKDKKNALEIAKRRVKLALLLNKTGEENQIKVTQEELKFELEKQLRNYPGQEKNIRDFYQKNPNELVKLRGPVFEDKVIDLIKSKAKITTKTLSKDDLIKLFNKDQDISKDQQKERGKSKKTSTTDNKTKAKKPTV